MEITVVFALVVAAMTGAPLVVDGAGSALGTGARIVQAGPAALRRVVWIRWLWVSTVISIGASLRSSPAGAATPPPMVRLSPPPDAIAPTPGVAALPLSTTDSVGGLQVSHVSTSHVAISHSVVRGDTLWDIAASVLGTLEPQSVDSYWREIYAANRQIIGSDPDFIVPGQLLIIPEV